MFIAWHLSAEVQPGALHALSAHGGCHQHVEEVVVIVYHRLVERHQRSMARLFARCTQLDLDFIVGHCHQVYPAVLGFTGMAYHGIARGLQAEGLAEGCLAEVEVDQSDSCALEGHAGCDVHYGEGLTGRRVE